MQDASIREIIETNAYLSILTLPDLTGSKLKGFCYKKSYTIQKQIASYIKNFVKDFLYRRLHGKTRV